ncbi:MAG: cation diffusion facilitator family transporter [Cytophagaceae bacterium]
MGHHHHHHHHHSHHHHHEHGNEKNLKVAFFINFAFTIIELIGGFYTNSMAIMSDAIHDLGDSLSLGLSWSFERISKKKRSSTFSFGYKRFSLLAALINANILVIGSIIIIIESLKRFTVPAEIKTTEMLIMAILGVVFNGIAFLRLEKGTGINVNVIRLHLLEDILGWVAVLIVAVIFQFHYIPFLDPLVSVLIAGYIIFNAIKNLKATLKIFLQAVPEEHNIDEIEQLIKNENQISSVHDLHIWSLSENYVILTAHIVLKEKMDSDKVAIIKNQIKEVLKRKGIEHATLEFETSDEHCHLQDC